MNQYSQRFSRQTILKGFGFEAQQKLQSSSVLVIGMGGLGCPIVEYLSSMGIGKLGIADNDTVSLSNLNRQFIFGEHHIGKNKAEIVAAHILNKHSAIEIQTYTERWNQQQCINFFPNYDIIVDGTDNFATRYMINDACVLLEKPLVYGAVSEFEGQVAVFNNKQPNNKRSCNYRDLFPIPPQENEVQNCSERGVLGVLPGIIGCMQALETVKMITGVGNSLINKLLTYNGMTQETLVFEFDENPDSTIMIPQDIEAFLETDYSLQCGIQTLNEMEWSNAKKLIEEQNALLVDIRELHEQPKILNIDHLSLPISELIFNQNKLQGENIIFVCQTGKRSLNAIQILQKEGLKVNMFSLKGGIYSIQ